MPDRPESTSAEWLGDLHEDFRSAPHAETAARTLRPRDLGPIGSDPFA